MRAFLLLLAMMSCAAFGAHAQQVSGALAGFRLGMSVDEARAVAPNLRWPEAQAAAFRMRGGDIELGGARFGLNLLFVRGALERISVEQGTPPIRDPQACLRALDDVVEDLELHLGPLNGAATEGEASGSQIGTTRTALASEVRHYHNAESDAYVGVARGSGDGQRYEARVLVMPGGHERWGCLFLLDVTRPVVQPPPYAPPDDGTPRLQNVVWIERPSGGDFARYYPTLAMEASQSGDVVLDCLIETGGLLSCNLVSEAPEGWEFGAAALSLSRQFRAGPQTRDGVATAGGRVIIPIHFRLG